MMMGIYNFKEQFAPYILDGSKTHTIRASRKHPDKPGDTLYLYVGLRRPGARKLLEVECAQVDPIRIFRASVSIDGHHLSRDEKDLLAWSDGFRHSRSIWAWPPASEYTGCFELMLEFWVKEHRAQEQPFDGDLIHWRFPG